MRAEHDIIVAPATQAGGAIAVVRLSGDGTLELADKIFRGKHALATTSGYTIRYGTIIDSDTVVDDVLVSVFRAPNSYTGEDSIEISCHGSRYITQTIIELLLRAGARMADHGEFTTRAFLAGKMDLSQAEAVADIIASSSRASLAMAATQMRGGYSASLRTLRDRLVRLTSLLELELDFSEEDVEFADRAELKQTMQEIALEISSLTASFKTGNAIKEGVAVAIVGRPNAGKSTLLNRLLNEERAMVSNIAGTTRDAIEEVTNIDGVLFRFIDTAGLHDTADTLERMGIERTHAAIERAQIVIQLLDAQDSNATKIEVRDDQTLIVVVNKIDTATATALTAISAKITGTSDDVSSDNTTSIFISAKRGDGIEELKNQLRQAVDTDAVYNGDTVVSNSRHYEALEQASLALNRAIAGIESRQPADLLSEDIRQVLYHIGTITGEITTDEILATIFSKFCIGK